MEKNRFKQLLESTMGDVKPLLVESEGSQNFVITNETTIEELDEYLYERIENNYGYGHSRSFEYFIQGLLKNSLVASGKSEEESKSMAEDFIERYMDNDMRSIPDQYDYYERREAGDTKYMGEIIFEYTTGGDGYGFSGSIKDLDKLLDDLKKLIQYGTIHDE